MNVKRNQTSVFLELVPTPREASSACVLQDSSCQTMDVVASTPGKVSALLDSIMENAPFLKPSTPRRIGAAAAPCPARAGETPVSCARRKQAWPSRSSVHTVMVLFKTEQTPEKTSMNALRVREFASMGSVLTPIALSAVNVHLDITSTTPALTAWTRTSAPSETPAATGHVLM